MLVSENILQNSKHDESNSRFRWFWVVASVLIFLFAVYLRVLPTGRHVAAYRSVLERALPQPGSTRMLVRELKLFDQPQHFVVQDGELFLLAQERRESMLLGPIITKTVWNSTQIAELRTQHPEVAGHFPAPDQAGGGVSWIR